MPITDRDIAAALGAELEDLAELPNEGTKAWFELVVAGREQQLEVATAELEATTATTGELQATAKALKARVAELEAFAKEAAEELEAAAQEAEDLADEISAASKSQPEDCFVRFKHTSVNGQQRIPVGAVVLNPTLQLLQATHGRWDWVTRETWAATPQRFVVARGLVWPWRA